MNLKVVPKYMSENHYKLNQKKLNIKNDKIWTFRKILMKLTTPRKNENHCKY